MFFQECSAYIWASQVAPWVQETQEMQVRSWVGKIPWRRAWQPTPIFLPGESHGQRTLTGQSPQCCKESDMTEATGHTLLVFDRSDLLSCTKGRVCVSHMSAQSRADWDLDNMFNPLPTPDSQPPQS